MITMKKQRVIILLFFIFFSASSVFAFLSKKQTASFITLSQKLSLQRSQTLFWDRIVEELQTQTYTFHTLLLIIANAEEQLKTSFSRELYDEVQQFYTTLFFELWDKLGESLQPITRKEVTKQLYILFNFSSHISNYNFLNGTVHKFYPRYIFRTDLINYFLTIKGLSIEACKNNETMLCYTLSEKKQLLFLARNTIKKMLEYLSSLQAHNYDVEYETNNNSHINDEEKLYDETIIEIQKFLQPLLRLFKDKIEPRFIVFEQEDFIKTTLPTLSSSLLKISAAICMPISLCEAGLALKRLYDIPFRKKIVPMMDEIKRTTQKINILIADLTPQNIQETYNDAMSKIQIWGDAKLEPLTKSFPKIDRAITIVSGEDTKEESGAIRHVPGILDTINGYNIDKNGQVVHVPGIVDEVKKITQEAKQIAELTHVYLGVPKKDKKGNTYDIGNGVAKITQRVARPFSEPDENDIINTSPQDIKKTLKTLHELGQEPPQRAHGQGEEEEEIDEYKTPPSSPQQQGRWCILQ